MAKETTFESKETTFEFKCMIPREKKGKIFDKDITFTLGGKKQSIYAYTQANREDTEIYPTLEKYGCIDKIIKPLNEIYGDASQIKDLRGTIEDLEKRNQIWNSIPLEIREKFDNDVSKFMKNGMKWAEEEMKKQKAAAENNSAAASTTTETNKE